MFKLSAVVASLGLAAQAVVLLEDEQGTGRGGKRGMEAAEWEALRAAKVAARETERAEKKAAVEAETEAREQDKPPRETRIKAERTERPEKPEGGHHESKWAKRAAAMGLTGGMEYADWLVSRDAWLSENEGMKAKDYWNYLSSSSE